MRTSGIGIGAPAGILLISLSSAGTIPLKDHYFLCRRNFSLSIFACLIIESIVPVASPGWLGTMTSRRDSGCRRSIWLPVCRTGL